VDGDFELLHVVLEDRLGDARLEDPHRPVFAVHRGRALSLVAVFLALLVHPRLGLLVVLPDAVVEVAREAADHALVARVGEAEAAARQPSEVLVGADDDGRLSHLLRLDRGDDARRGSAIDQEVGRFFGRAGGEQGDEDGRKSFDQRKFSDSPHISARRPRITPRRW
jgi:hypothetical protein